MPLVGVTRLSIIRSVVVLPAPLGPRNPVTRPGSTVNDRSSTALTLWYSLVRPETTICPSDMRRSLRAHVKAAISALSQHSVAAIKAALGRRSATRITCFRPDQISSIAHTLTSTRPWARANSRTTFSSRSVAIPEDRFGQAIHSAPAGVASAGAAPASAAAAGRVRAEADDHVVRGRARCAGAAPRPGGSSSQLEPGRRAVQQHAVPGVDAELLGQWRT